MNRPVVRQFKQARGVLIAVISLSVPGTIVTLVQMTLLSTVVSRVFLFHQQLRQLIPLLLLLSGSIVIHALLLWGREIVAQCGAVRIKTTLREQLLTHVMQLGPAYSKNERTGELVATASQGIETLDAYFSRYLPQIILSVLIPLMIVAYIFALDWASALLLLVTGPIIPLLMILVGSYAEKHIQHQWLALSRINAYLLDAIQGITTLKLFGQSQKEHERITRFSDALRERTMKTLRVAFLSGMVLEFLSAVAIGLIAVTLGVRLINGNITFEHAFLILLLAPEFYRPLRELGVHRHAGLEGNIAAQRIYEILDTPLPVKIGTISTKVPARQLTITMTDIAYTYPGQERSAVQGVSLTLPAGSCTALIGKSGAGKSTLVNLLLRFIDTQNGTISANGIDLQALSTETWREYIALVPQHPYLFYDSVRANIRLARPMASDQEIEQAAQLAGATEFISRLPQGYTTEIGERGIRLSAGQAQRIAIARAFLKDAPLLILDEPTSSLDPLSERLISTALKQLMQGRTVLVIAHRYNTINMADYIAVLDTGRLIEGGKREDVLRKQDAYSYFMRQQEKAQVTP